MIRKWLDRRQQLQRDRAQAERIAQWARTRRLIVTADGAPILSERLDMLHITERWGATLELDIPPFRIAIVPDDSATDTRARE